MKRNKRGITLIALIITIIVLLILAGVTISFVVGDNGVLTQAQKAKLRTDKESAEEEVKLEVAGSYDDEGNLDLELLNKNLMNNLKDLKLKDKTTGEYKEFNDTNKIENLPAIVYYKQNEVTINGKQLISDVAKNVENYGMYVNYPIDLDGDTSTSDWKIFYEDETGRVFLIAADYVPNTCEALTKAKESQNANMTQNSNDGWSVCTSYWATSSSATYHCNDGRSTEHQDKAQCSFPEIFMPDGDFCEKKDSENGYNHYYCSSHTTYTNSKCASALQCTGNWSSFKTGYADYAIGGPTLEMWVASWNGKHGKDVNGESNGKTLYADGCNNAGNGYKIGENSSSTSTSIDLSSCEGCNDTLYFPHLKEYEKLDLFGDGKHVSNEEGKEKKLVDEPENAKCFGYWLASPSAYGSDADDVVSVSYSGKVCSADYYGNYAVRPVVSLQSGVYVEVQEDVTNEDGTVIKSCRLVK